MIKTGHLFQTVKEVLPTFSQHNVLYNYRELVNCTQRMYRQTTHELTDDYTRSRSAEKTKQRKSSIFNKLEITPTVN